MLIASPRHLRPCSSLSRVDKRRHELRWLIVLCRLAHELIPIGVTPYMNLLVLRQRRELPMLSCTVSTRPHRRTASRAPVERSGRGPRPRPPAVPVGPPRRARARAAFTTTVKGPRCAHIPQASSGTAWALALGASAAGLSGGFSRALGSARVLVMVFGLRATRQRTWSMPSSRRERIAKPATPRPVLWPLSETHIIFDCLHKNGNFRYRIARRPRERRLVCGGLGPWRRPGGEHVRMQSRVVRRG